MHMNSPFSKGYFHLRISRFPWFSRLSNNPPFPTHVIYQVQDLHLLPVI